MSRIGSKSLIVSLLFRSVATTLITIIITTQSGYAQTNLQELQDHIKALKKKLAIAKKQQEKAYSIQIKLEEQEQRLAKLSKPDKYKIQIIEIRDDIKNIRTKIQLIIKENNSLEENLKNLQTILTESQKIPKAEAIIQINPDREPHPINTNNRNTVKKANTPIKLETVAISSITPRGEIWRIDNIQVGSHFTDDEHSEIMNIFGTDRLISQDDILKKAYQIYSHVGINLHFVLHPKNDNVADLEVLLSQREDNANSYFTFFTPMTFNQFKSERFDLKIVK